jgi:6-phosphogluconolactonase
VLNELALSVTSFRYDGAGGMKQLSTTPSLSEEVKAQETFNSASEICVHPSGSFVYSANRGNDSITAYKANLKTGRLDVLEVEPIRGAWPRNFNLDPSGRWLLAAGKDSNTVTVFAIDQVSGKLSYPTRRIYPVPRSICILFGRSE